MRTIYISNDGQYRCHVKNGENRTALDVEMFDSKCNGYIEGYRYIPAGESWTRDDGVVFEGEMICPAIDIIQLYGAQQEDEHAALSYIGALSVKSPSETAREMRAAIDTMSEKLDDGDAVNMSVLFPTWSGQGVSYYTGDRIQYQGQLFRCLQNHTSQPDWIPGIAVSLFVEISNQLEEWPEWRQPTGAHDAYDVGAKVAYNGDRYVSKISGNTAVPGSDSRWWEKQNRSILK